MQNIENLHILLQSVNPIFACYLSSTLNHD